MRTVSIIAAAGYVLLGISLVVGQDYMDAFVVFTIALIFASGMPDVYSGKKSGFAHIVTGGLIGSIFTGYYVIEYFAAGFDALIMEGHFSTGAAWNLVGAVILGILSVGSFMASRKQFKAKR